MDELIAFITARLDDDELAARNAGGEAWDFTGSLCEVRVREADGALGRIIAYCRHGNPLPDDLALAIHIGNSDPVRVLREVEAKREIVRQYCESRELLSERETYDLVRSAVGALRFAVVQLAAVWSDHPDYRQEWKP